MTSELLTKQIETYSNAIVAFAVLQGLSYSYAFGTNAFFNCLIKTSSHLAEGLTLLFVLVTLLSIIATVLLGRALQQISGEFRGMVEKIYVGKLVAVIIFSLLPLALTVGYGVRDYQDKMQCKTTAGMSNNHNHVTPY
jgi:hypothetical protein